MRTKRWLLVGTVLPALVLSQAGQAFAEAGYRVAQAPAAGDEDPRGPRRPQQPQGGQPGQQRGPERPAAPTAPAQPQASASKHSRATGCSDARARRC